MANLRDIRNRINNAKSSEKITQSMKTISTARLANIKVIKNNTNNYFKQNEMIFDYLFQKHQSLVQKDNNYLYTSNDSSTVLIIIYTSERGLCGSYNNNVLKKLTTLTNDLQAKNRQFKILAFGKKGYSFISSRYKKEEIIDITYPLEIKKVSSNDILFLSNYILSLLDSGKIGQVEIIHTHFINALKQELRHKVVIPITKDPQNETKESPKQESQIQNEQSNPYIVSDDYFLPNIQKNLVSTYIYNHLYKNLIRSILSEQSARVSAMDNAYNNAKDLIKALVLDYNRKRQSLITKELIEIISGAEAL
jgi:F-type H+-transporting ATPase subunit gamma